MTQPIRIEAWKCENHGYLQASAAMGEPKRCPVHMVDWDPCNKPLGGPYEMTINPKEGD